MKRILHSVAGLAGTEIAVLLALGAIALLISGHGADLSAMELASGNF